MRRREAAGLRQERDVQSLGGCGGGLSHIHKPVRAPPPQPARAGHPPISPPLRAFSSRYGSGGSPYALTTTECGRPRRALHWPRGEAPSRSCGRHRAQNRGVLVMRQPQRQAPQRSGRGRSGLASRSGERGARRAGPRARTEASGPVEQPSVTATTSPCSSASRAKRLASPCGAWGALHGVADGAPGERVHRRREGCWLWRPAPSAPSAGRKLVSSLSSAEPPASERGEYTTLSANQNAAPQRNISVRRSRAAPSSLYSRNERRKKARTFGATASWTEPCPPSCELLCAGLYPGNRNDTSVYQTEAVRTRSKRTGRNCEGIQF